MNSPEALDVKVFVPARNFLESLRFYKALGWRVNFQAEDNTLAELELAGTRFFLQNFYHKDWAENFMLYINVEDARAWHTHVANVIQEGDWQHVRVQEPQEQSYGALVTFVWDPSGVLLHFAELRE